MLGKEIERGNQRKKKGNGERERETRRQGWRDGNRERYREKETEKQTKFHHFNLYTIVEYFVSSTKF